MDFYSEMEQRYPATTSRGNYGTRGRQDRRDEKALGVFRSHGFIAVKQVARTWGKSSCVCGSLGAHTHNKTTVQFWRSHQTRLDLATVGLELVCPC
jgi:hypothetical protein